jgi:hypothetical protein
MLHKNGPLFRMVLVLALGAGLAALAVRPAKKIPASADLPMPRVLSIAADSQFPEFCLTPPREDKEPATSDKQPDDQGEPRVKKKIIACG